MSSFGGCVSTVSTFQDIVKKSEAHFHGILEGYGYSSGGAIFLLCDTQEVADMADMMIHTVQTSSTGSSQSVESRGIKVGKGARQFMERIYPDFLTQEEIEEALIGKEFWFTSDEIRERLATREAIRHQREVDAAKEEYTPEVYASQILEDISEDCETFGYSVDEIILSLAKSMLPVVEEEELEGKGDSDSEETKDMIAWSVGDVKTTDDLQLLRYIGNSCNIKFSYNIGIEKLRKRILDFLEK